MAKNLTITQWVNTITLYKTKGIEAAVNYYKNFKNPRHRKGIKKNIKKKTKLYDNYGMDALKRTKGSGRPHGSKKRDDSDISSIIDSFTEEQKREIIEHWLKEQRNKNDKGALAKFKLLTKSQISKILNFHRTSLYKKKKEKKYKYDYLKDEVKVIFTDSLEIYGSRKILNKLKEKYLEKGEILEINSRTLRNYMKRWEIIVETRTNAQKPKEDKNTKVQFEDKVKRNFNPEEDNVLGTDISYIHTSEKTNHLYLSVAINHKTKYIESWKLSRNNDAQLVVDTIKQLGRTDFIFHSDHGSTYSSVLVLDELKRVEGQTSMGRVGNSLDNREVEYFFGCLKGEYLTRRKPWGMNFDELNEHISIYIDWYNNKRIQKILNWKTPAFASVISQQL